MTRSLAGIVIAIAVANSISPACAQSAYPSASQQWLWPKQAYAPGTYQPAPFLNAPSAGEAYKQGLINRWELERYEGPTPQAMQGPSPDGGSQGGGDRSGN